MQRSIDLTGRTALITGGSSGIGKTTALTLSGAGARVVIGDINATAGAEVVDQINEAGGSAQFVSLDITDRSSVEEARTAIADGLGAVDILVNNAGWTTTGRFEDAKADIIDRQIAINLTGTMSMCQAFLPDLIKSEHTGTIINIASEAGRIGNAGETAYAGAKGGVIAFSKSLAREMARHAVSVNCVSPGVTDTPLFRAQPEEAQQKMLKLIPFRRPAQPQDIADAVLFFSSDLASYVTGQVLSVNGGLTMVD